MIISEDLELKSALQWRFSIFEAFYNTIIIEYSKGIDTAAVTFDSEGDCLKMLINEEFWSKLNLPQKEFIICHETLHVIYNHGSRGKNLDPNIANIAMDLVINEELVRNHQFNRMVIDPDNNFVWHDKYFPTETFQFKSFEFYYDKLKKNHPEMAVGTTGSKNDNALDNHDDLENIPNDIVEEILDKAVEIEIEVPENAGKDIDILDELNGQEILASGILAGNGALGKQYAIVVPTPSNNTKFYKFIDNMTIKRWKEDNEYSWIDKPRRIYTINSDFFIPNEKEVTVIKKDRVKVVVFMDTSGSCIDYKEYFWKIASAIPTDRFDTDLYCFDTRVYQTTLKSRKIYGGGGTSFYILDRKIREYKKHPDLVFVITDGYGDSLNIEQPKKWVWLLTKYNTKEYIHKDSVFEPLDRFDLK